MKQDLLFIEGEGHLFRGFGRLYPIIAWSAEEKRWTSRPQSERKPEEWGELISRLEAERCYPGSTTAPLPEGTELMRELSFEEMIRYRGELFDGYDGPITRKSPDEARRYFEAVAPEHVKNKTAERRTTKSKL